MDEASKQRLDELAGVRQRGATGRAAVRIEDLQGLLSLPESLKSAAAAGSAPTKAEFDALVDDVGAIHRRLVAIMSALRSRQGR